MFVSILSSRLILSPKISLLWTLSLFVDSFLSKSTWLRLKFRVRYLFVRSKARTINLVSSTINRRDNRGEVFDESFYRLRLSLAIESGPFISTLTITHRDRRRDKDLARQVALSARCLFYPASIRGDVTLDPKRISSRWFHRWRSLNGEMSRHTHV